MSKKNISKNELYRRGANIYSEDPHGVHTFVCLNCSAIYTPMLAEGGELPRGYWVCPNKCNKGASKWAAHEKYVIPKE